LLDLFGEPVNKVKTKNQTLSSRKTSLKLILAKFGGMSDILTKEAFGRPGAR
jgi:hypothetical protein